MNPPQHPKEPRPLDTPYPALEFDIEKYRPYFADSDLTEAQKTELLNTLWNIMVAFIDLGFGVHPVQQACGKLQENRPKSALTTPDAVYSDARYLVEKFIADAGLEADLCEEGLEV